jgi:hypothetical protein
MFVSQLAIMVPNAAQEKKVILDFATPASFSQSPNVEKISKIGTPAEKPRKSMVITRGMKMNSLLLLGALIAKKTLKLF